MDAGKGCDLTPKAGNPDSYPITVDLPDDADPPAAATFNVANGGWADRTASLANGYQSEYADTTALKAVDTTLLPNGAIRRVAGLGRFVLDKVANPAFAETLPIVVAPTTGTGRWYAQDPIALAQWVVTLQANAAGNIPPNVHRLRYEICGGGGGGGGGGPANTNAAPGASGGGGGAGAQYLVGEIDVTPGGGWVYTNGTAGAGGAGGNGVPGGDGTDGGDSSFTQGFASVIAPGGQGGRGGGLGTGTTALVVPGGTTAGKNSPKPARFQSASGAPAQMALGPGAGGWSSDNFVPSAQVAGARSITGQSGGVAGVSGTIITNPGGQGGGGGGAGPYASGGAGGAGGNGAAAGNGANGVNGSAAPTANTGAGGGGGGGGGNGSTSGAIGGNGGAGSAGQMMFRAVR